MKASGSGLMDLRGVGPVVAARVLSDVGDVARFANRNRFASWTGTAPIEASSGEIVRHRLSRAGNRRMNHMIHIAAATQIRLDSPGRAYDRRKLAAGKTRAEALRCLKRRISDALYRQLLADARATEQAAAVTGPGGHRGASHESSAAGSHPHTGTSGQPLPGPAATTLRAPSPARKTNAASHLEPPIDDRGVPKGRTQPAAVVPGGLEPKERDSPGPLGLGQQARRDEEARDDEEDVCPDEASGHHVHAEVIDEHEQNGDRSQALDVATPDGADCRRTGCT